ncbi:MAG: DUF4012 domain-containing protein [Candidatus Parcubacteria bacterium]|nr:DUF4012 domain-containing protein [Candidatus Parcubacteria bacterium]
MSEINQNLEFPKPDFSQITERPRKSYWKKSLVLIIKIFLAVLVLAIIFLAVLGALYYKDLQAAYSFSLSAKGNLDLAMHQLTNREFKEAAASIKLSNDDFNLAQKLLDKIKLVRSVPYIGTQLKAVDQVLIAGIKLTDSGQKVVLLIDDITAPLKNESITYATITTEQKKEILNKIVQSESMLNEVQKEIDEADVAIESIPANGLVKPLKDGISPLKENLPKVKKLIDHVLPLLDVIPKVVGFDQAKTYLFLLQNNSELRPTGGFIGTYGILKLQDGEIKEFDTDNVYNLDRSAQPIVKEPTPWPIAKYLEQKNWSLRDINWEPDFPTTAQKSLDIYKKENLALIDLKKSGQKILGEKGVIITDVIPYEENLYGVIAITPEILGGLLKLTGPIVAQDMIFTDTNYQDQLELMVGKLYQELNVPIAERKGIIKKLSDQIKIKLFTLPLSKVPDLLDIAYKALDQKQVMFYSVDPDLEKLILAKNWGGEIQKTDNDYLMVVDSNMASLKTDQYVDRTINYSFANKNGDLIAKVTIIYKNNADFTWKSTRLRTYARVYVPLGSELISSQGAMENDKIKDPSHQPGQIEKGQEFDKTYFGAFISIEPHETGVLSFEYKLPKKIVEQINLGTYNLLIQKQPGVIPNLTLDLKFDKNIKSATPAEEQKEWFNNSYKYSAALDTDKSFVVSF